MEKRIRNGTEGWEPYTREYEPDIPTRPYPSIWADLPTMRQAKAVLKETFQTSDLFDTPKPSELIERFLQMIDDKNAIILDSFAGSGTTAHAVLNMNKADGGNRSFSRADFSQPREMFSIVTGMSFSAFNSADNVRF